MKKSQKKLRVSEKRLLEEFQSLTGTHRSFKENAISMTRQEIPLTQENMLRRLNASSLIEDAEFRASLPDVFWKMPEE